MSKITFDNGSEITSIKTTGNTVRGKRRQIISFEDDTTSKKKVRHIVDRWLNKILNIKED